MLLRILSFSMLFTLVSPLWADTVWLANGDRLSGEIVLLDGGKLALKTRYAGQVLIDWQDIDTLRSDKPLLLRRRGLDSQHSRQLAAAGSGMVRVIDTTTETVPLASITRLVPPRPLLRDLVWEGNLDAKLDMERNQDDRDEWRVKGNSRVEHGRWRHVLTGELERETRNGREVDDNWRLEYDLDRFFNRHWFWRTGVEQAEDGFEFFTRQRILGSGPGYRFWDDELGRFDLIGQLNRVQLESRSGARTFDSLSLEWDYKRLLWGTRLELYSNAELQVPEIAAVDYVFDSEFGLRYRLNSWARLSLLYELEQIRGLGQSTSERHYLIGLGVGW
ncbi:DUF481 domain-containing protein [Pseudomonas lalucatii]|uniref:DUF481 domain-containing protein n=1 Tax=Pseudomonas lalucatii TaxID=1424203 RepID=A0ABS5Q5B1_9PSED|nr:DUF481 domain-containing protein [Pseudomonas lalucatii]MBS7663785.1 DUF481 domain-containing protein [Pseudomonas lalucatii]MBS7689678.1 DUF481 domain-containing protein [Pseudomonas lalucatii]MBS7725213.1 DUF481 domain-containing protein [Pseudomonas lalucatii]QVM86828.1 DUF481 domain-containing protein [Pseudomonas lalucatii]